MRRIRLVIADRRPIVLQGFASLLAAEHDFEVVASCLNGAGCLEAIRNLTPDVVLVEDGFSDVTASEMLAVTNAEKLPTRLVFYTASVARGDVADAIAAGACNAISMRAKPETVLKSLRLVAPRFDRAPASKAENGGSVEQVLAALTDKERKIMRLVAYGLSNKEIARQLNVRPGTIGAHLDQICQKVHIQNRTGLAALALSRLSGGIGVLAAVIFAALDDVRAADHTLADTFTIVAADGTEVATITIAPRKSVDASDTAAKATIRADRVDNPGKGTPALAGKFVDASVDIASRTITPAALNSARPSLGSSSAFMMVATGVLIYALDLMFRPAHAFDFGNSLTEGSTSATANGTNGSLAPDIPRSANANYDGFDDLVWLNREISDRSFVFDNLRSDIIALHGDEHQIIGVDAREDTASHHGLHAKSEADASQYFEHGTAISSAGEYPNRGQLQRDLHAVENGSAAKQDTKDNAPGDEPNRGQSQRDFPAAENGSAAKQDVKHNAPGDDSNRGQSQRDLHASADDPTAAKQDAKHNAPGDDSSREQSQRDLHASEKATPPEQHTSKHATPESASNPDHSQRNLHAQSVDDAKNQYSESSPVPGGKDRGTDDVSKAEKVAALDTGDSFHFKNEMADYKASKVYVDQQPASTEHGSAGLDGLTPMQTPYLTSMLLAEQNAVDHATSAEHPLAHFLIV